MVDHKKDSETIRERTITVKLSDADCESLSRKCGKHGLSVGDLIASFVGDFIDGTCSNGSDERMYIKQWFDRWNFAIYPGETLLHHLLFWGFDPEDYLNIWNYIQSAKEEKEHLAAHPEDADEESQYLDDDIADWQEELQTMKEDWNPKQKPNMEEELERIQKWVEDRKNLLNK